MSSNQRIPKHPYRRTVKSDRVDAWAFQNLNMIYCCEQCSHFDGENRACTIGYTASDHCRQTADESFRLDGRIAFCRFLEID